MFCTGKDANTTAPALCTSSALLMQVSFLASVLCEHLLRICYQRDETDRLEGLGYFMLLLFTTIAHSNIYPDIWARRVFDVEWFTIPMQSRRRISRVSSGRASVESLMSMYASSERPDSPTLGTSDPRILETELEGKDQSWVPQVRRGVDHPFGGARMDQQRISGAPIQPGAAGLRSSRGVDHDVEARRHSTTSDCPSLPVTVSSLGSLLYLAAPVPMAPRPSSKGKAPEKIPVVRFSSSLYSQGT